MNHPTAAPRQSADRSTSGRGQSSTDLFVNNVAQLVSSVGDLDELYRGIERAVSTAIPSDRFSLAVVSPAGDSYSHVYVSGRSIDGWKTGNLVPRSENRIWRILDGGTPVALNAPTGQLRSLLVIPVVAFGKLIAGINLRSVATSAYGAGHIEKATTVAQALSIPLASLPLCVEVTNKAAHAETVAAIGRVVSGTRDIASVYDQFADLVRNLISFDRLSISQAEPELNALRVLHVAGADLPNRSEGATRPLRGTLVSSALSAGKAISLGSGDLRRSVRGADDLVDAGLKSVLAAPLRLEGKPVGALLVARRDPRGFTDYELRLAERIGTQIAGVVASEAQKNALEEEQIRRLKAEAAELELIGTAREKFNALASISDQLLSPLDAIESGSELLAPVVNDHGSDEHREYLDGILGHTRGLRDTIESLLHLPDLDTSSPRIEKVETDLVPALRDAVDEARKRAAESGNTLQADLPPGSAIANADIERLALAFSDVIENAIRCSKQGVIEVAVGIVTNRLNIVVSNTASETTDGPMGRIVDPGISVYGAASNVVHDSGDGLAIARAVVELHGGTVSLDRDRPGYMRVSMSLPLIRHDQGQSPGSRKDSTTVGPGNPARSMDTPALNRIPDDGWEENEMERMRRATLIQRAMKARQSRAERELSDR